MPIWADFMREALQNIPNGTAIGRCRIRFGKAEIDSRNGKFIRELNSGEADSVKAQQTAIKKYQFEFKYES